MYHPPKQAPEQVHQALRAISPRPYTDSLVQGFFENANHHYGIIHRPSFMESYVEWWSQRHQPQQLPSILNITFTGLVLRMCASSAQFLSPVSYRGPGRCVYRSGAQVSKLSF